MAQKEAREDEEFMLVQNIGAFVQALGETSSRWKKQNSSDSLQVLKLFVHQKIVSIV
jgi:hypothetical protein